jgi:hypothetical protein
MKPLLHETNYILKQYCVWSTKKICTLHWNPGPNYNIYIIKLSILRMCDTDTYKQVKK